MLSYVKKTIDERRPALSKVAGVLYGAHAVRGYITDRLDELKEKLEQDQFARNNLRSRFTRNQDDVSFIVLALLPTLSDQVLEVMDIEALIGELQNKVKTKQPASVRQPLARSPTDLSGTGSQDMSDSESQLSASVASSTFSAVPSAPGDDMSISGLQGWIEGSHESPSVISLGSDAYTSSSGEQSIASSSPSVSSIPVPIRSKGEIWNQIKLQTFTRTLTVLYSTTLLSLLTTVQLTILARYKYIRSIEQAAHEARMREAFEAQFSLSGMLWGAWKGMDSLLAGDLSQLMAPAPVNSRFDIPDESESKFLSLSWWMLHVGWKDVSERVQRGVDEVFEGMTVKSNLTVLDLHRLVKDVRRRVEHEITFEGLERMTNFQSSLLPPTHETLQHLLTQNGYGTEFTTAIESSAPSISLGSSPSSSVLGESNPGRQGAAFESDPVFIALLEETRQTLSSSDFTYTLSAVLDRGTEVLFTDVEQSVFHLEGAPTDEAIRIRLANMLPGLARWSQNVLEGYPSVLIDNVLGSSEVTTLSALIFAKFADETW